jgi:dinuclear metal center YbgI/SA1388 family protein
MVRTQDIVEFLNKKLEIEKFSDSSLNGLQVEGSEQCDLLAVAVDAGTSVIEKARDCGAQVLLVHHGIFWGTVSPLTGALRRKIGLLFDSGINLYAAHLPLDAHSEVGNNFGLARRLDLSERVPAIEYRGRAIGCIGRNQQQLDLSQLSTILSQLPGARTPFLTLGFGPQIPERICIVSGAGADALERAQAEHFDTLITGEPRQSAYHYARENKLNVIFAGHYASETVGVIETAKLIEKEFSLPWRFIDEPTGI